MLRINHLYKIYGNNEEEAMKLIKEGYGKKEIKKKINAVVGVNDISLNVKNREIFVIMGLSGSGKSTLVRCINRLIEPTSGEIFIENDNEPIEISSLNNNDLREVRRKMISMVFQNAAVLPHLSVKENILFGLELQNKAVENKDRVNEIIKLIGLEGWEDAYPEQLSGGMKQRVGLGRALVVDTDILLMDEPFTGLDPLIKREMQEWFLDLISKIDKTVIFITHDMQEALKIGNRIAIMKSGNIVQVGTRKEIIDHPVNEYVKDFVSDIKKLMRGDF